jgi:Flp pilus assembly protein TadG
MAPLQLRHLLADRVPGNAIVEMALLAPVLGLLLAGLGAIAIVVQAQLGLVAVAEEAALAATYAPSRHKSSIREARASSRFH